MILMRISFCLRYGLTLAGALALLYALSYPDSLLPPSPDVEYVQGFTVYDIKPIIWLVPLLFMELVSGLGTHRNKVWFMAMGTVLIGGVVVFPVLHAWAPELVTRTLPFEDGKLEWGLFYFALITAASFLLRCGLFVYLFHEPHQDDQDENALDSDVLDPAHALTVREIAAHPVRAKVRFLFGAPDQSVIERFMMLVRRLIFLRRRRGAIYLLLGALLVLWFFLYPQPSPSEALQRDLRVMYEHTRQGDGTCRATSRAVHAALRVLRYVSNKELFAGKTLHQAREWLQVQRAPADYRAQLLDDSDMRLASVDDVFDSRTRFFTVSDGKRTAALFIFTDKEGNHINVSETVDAGWNAIADDRRRKFGTDVSARFFSR